MLDEMLPDETIIRESSTIHKDDQGINSGKKRFTLNVLSNVLGMVLNGAVGIILTPYLIKNLGVDLFGIVALAMTANNYLRIISNSLIISVGRYLTIDLQSRHFQTANKTFNTALWSSIVINLGLIPVIIVVAIVIPNVLNVPPGYELSSQVLFGVIMLAYSMNIVQSVFAVSTFSMNRFDFLNLINSINVVVRFLAIILIFEFIRSDIIFVGVSELLAVLAAFAAAFFVWRHLTPQLNINFKAFEKSRLQDLSRMSVWVLFNEVGSQIFLNIDLIIVNIYLGASLAGRYGSLLQWPLLLRVLASTVASVLTPLILSHHARGEMAAATQLIIRVMKVLGITMAFPIGLVAGLAAPLLNLWLGADFVPLTLVLQVLILPLCINLAVLPLFSMQVTLNKVRWPALVTLMTSIIKILLAIVWIHLGENGYGIALAGAIVLTFKNFMFTTLYGAYIEKLPWYTYMKGMFPIVISTIMVFGVSTFCANNMAIDSWAKTILFGLVFAPFYFLIVYLFVFGKNERQVLLSLIRNK